MIAHTIQLALAPVFVLVAIGNIMNILSTRLGRIVDRWRQLENLHRTTQGEEHDALVIEARAIDQRMALNNRAIRLLVLAGLAIGATVTVLFLEELLDVPLERLAAGIFILAVGLLMWALLLFLRETQVAAATLRIPRTYLELHREL